MQFQTSHIPSDIDTYEKLIAWAGDILFTHGGSLSYNERQPNAALGDSGIQSIFERSDPGISANKDYRVIYRMALLLKDDYLSPAYPFTYQAVEEVLNVPINVNFIA